MQSKVRQNNEQDSTDNVKTPVAQRLKCIAKFYGIPIRAFERACGLTPGYIAAIRKSIGKDKLDKIVERYPDINPSWVLFGEGDMLRKNGDDGGIQNLTIDREVWGEIQKMTETVNSQQKTIAVQAESIRHQADSLYLLLKDAQIEGLTVAKSSPNEGKTE